MVPLIRVLEAPPPKPKNSVNEDSELDDDENDRKVCPDSRTNFIIVRLIYTSLCDAILYMYCIHVDQMHMKRIIYMYVFMYTCMLYIICVDCYSFFFVCVCV